MSFNTSDYRIEPGTQVDLDARASRDDGGLDKDEGKDRFKALRKRLVELQELLYAEDKHSLLVVFQAMDAGGKDSTIRHVFGRVNPQGCRVASFKSPSTLEGAHDFLWRIHDQVPKRGMIRVFNRSHYEDVLIVRVKGFVPESVWSRRYEHINNFEKLLADEGTHILKFYLHISKDYQRERLQRRLDRPDKHWKFNPDDLSERQRWDAYRVAFEDAIGRCATGHAPWYVVPSERRWFRDLLVAQVIVDKLESLDMRYPEPTFDPEEIEIP